MTDLSISYYQARPVSPITPTRRMQPNPPSIAPLPQARFRFLGRIGEALLMMFIVIIVFGLFPLKIADAIWQEQICGLLRTLSIYPLVGSVFIFLCESDSKSLSPPFFPLRRIQKLAPLAALGFILMIPLQANSAYLQIRDSDVQARAQIRQFSRKIALFRSISSLSDLQFATQDLAPNLRPAPGESLQTGRLRLVTQAESELVNLRILAEKTKREVTTKAIPIVARDGLFCLINAVAFVGMRRVREPVPAEASAATPDTDQLIP